MKLNDMRVRNANPKDKPYKLTDGLGLYLLVKPNGTRCWRFDYARHEKRKTLALGVYPVVSLREARTRRDDAKEKLRHGEDPSHKSHGLSFGEIAIEWLDRKVRPVAAAATITKTEWLLTFTSDLDRRDITAIKAPDVLAVLRRLEDQGKLESAKRLRSTCSRVFRYAIATGRAERDVCADLAGAIVPPKAVHRAAPLTPEKIGALMRAINDYQGHPATGAAMRLGALTFVRPGELRFAVWEEFDFANSLWRIPAERMKMKRDHLVPLSRQALRVLDRLREIYEPCGLMFPSYTTDDKPISENTVNKALRLLGFTKDEATHHGFRRMASTILNERGWNRDWIERQLAHIETNQVRGAYNAAEYLEGRTEMMQAWADLLDDFEIADMIG